MNNNKTVYIALISLPILIISATYLTWIAYFSLFLPNSYYRYSIEILLLTVSLYYLVRSIIKEKKFKLKVKRGLSAIIRIAIVVSLMWLPLNIGLPYVFHTLWISPFCSITTLEKKGVSLYTKMGMKYYWRLGDGFNFKKIGVSIDIFDIANVGDSIKISGDKNFLGYTIHSISRN